MSSPRGLYAAVALALWCAPKWVQAQEMELGLDLSDATDYRPALAIIGVAAADSTISPAVVEKLKVDRLSASLLAAAQRSGLFSSVLAPADVFAKLEDGYTDALGCRDAACLAALASKLDVNVVSLGQLVTVQGKPQLELRTYVRYRPGVDTAPVRADVRASQLEREAVPAFTELLKKSVTPLAMLKVTSDAQGATAVLGEHKLGPVPFEKRVPPGNYTLKVEAPGFLPDDVEVSLKAGEKKAIEANLVPKPPEMPQVTEAPQVVEKVEAEPSSRRPGIWKRPGLYMAVAGAALVGAGALLGSGAKGVEARARDGNGDGVLDITRRERANAERDALLANVFAGVGGAALVGGTIWVLVTPAAAGTATGSEEPLALALAIGGTFP